ncbi:MAG: YitT family protein [Desulfuromonadaceae bacterium]|nr:YitT family protein [Desulfuromonas sp.]MDY0184957.1 YitT family protein [Desulfuromonadaceae bacterium]
MAPKLFGKIKAETQSLKDHISLHGPRKIILYQAGIAIGAIIAAFGYSMFMIPFNLAAGGVAGLGVIISHFSGLSPGTLYMLMNLPLLVLGFIQLGRFRFLFSCLLSIVVFSIAADIFSASMPRNMHTFPITQDLLLNSIYGGLFFGLGVGLVLRYGGNFGGTVIPAQILYNKTGYPLSQAFFYLDGGIILLAGAVFGWELAMLGMLALLVGGMTADLVLEGPSQVRTVTIVSQNPTMLKHTILADLGRGISFWDVTGGYSNQNFTMLFCTITRSQVQDLKAIVADNDPDAFLVVGIAQQAVGSFSFKGHNSRTSRQKPPSPISSNVPANAPAAPDMLLQINTANRPAPSSEPDADV